MFLIQAKIQNTSSPLKVFIDSPSHEQIGMRANLDRMHRDRKGTSILHEILFECLTFQF